MPTAENGAKDGKPGGAVIRKWRNALWNRQGRKCHYCARSIGIGKATLDHIVPKSKGGPWKKSNMVVACEPCNNKRGDMDYQEFLELCGR